MDVCTSIIDLIGRTPILRLKALEPEGGAEIWAKMEQFTPGGSVKDRIALGMIRAAIATGELAPGGAIVEATAGNTGIALAIVGRQLGYRVVLFVPEKFSVEKQVLMRALGADLTITPTEDGMEGARERARAFVADHPGSVYVDQFGNPANPASHQSTTGPEVWAQMEGRLDAWVVGLGSAGTFSGTGRFLKAQDPSILCVAVEPTGSILCGNTDESHEVEGIGLPCIWSTVATEIIDRVVVVPDPPAFAMVRRLARDCGLLAASSAAANVCAAIEIAADLEPEQRVVTVIPDSSERYLSKGIYQLFAAQD